MNKLSRFATPILATLAILLAVLLTYDRVGTGSGLAQELDPSAEAAQARQRAPYDLTRLAVMQRAILEVSRQYVDPERVNYQRMYLAGLNGIQRTVAPVLVDYDEEAGSVRVNVRSESQGFRVADIDSPWLLTQRFREAFSFLQANLGDEEELDLRDVEYAAVNGMLRTLDPHTLLLTPDDFEEMQMSTRGEFGGLGIVISIREGHLTVIKPMPNTPASRAGLQRGDRIMQINDESTLNMPLSEAVDRLRGQPGSTVNVYYSRRRGNTWTSPRRVELVRAIIHIDSVEHRRLADGIGYIRIRGFQGNTHEDMQRALVDLHREDLRGLVLDLRDNPGGLLTQAARVADTFLESGPS